MTLEAKILPIEEHLDGRYSKGNIGSTVPVSYTTHIRLHDGKGTTVSLARHRKRDAASLFEPTLMSIEVDELDGLIDLLTETRDALADRGLTTRYDKGN